MGAPEKLTLRCRWNKEGGPAIFDPSAPEVEYIRADLVAAKDAEIAKIRGHAENARRSLDNYLGDTDPDLPDDLTHEELEQEEPVLYAHIELVEALFPVSTATPQEVEMWKWVQRACEESLSPDGLAMWEEVYSRLMLSRAALNGGEG